jgi:2-polyprenyl-6-hydroxyphenyl methylase/3-demethylubiquinone-9 3-methyltransferase
MATSAGVNNAFYDSLGERWFSAQDDPVALLRAEGELKQAWVEERLRKLLGLPRHGPEGHWSPPPPLVLDVGCGAGFLAHHLAVLGYAVLGVDRSFGSLRMAHSLSAAAAFQRGDALRLPFRSGTFDAACAMDFLEHVEDPGAVIAEAARVLRPGGLFFFHTFNRNLLSWLVAVKGPEWFVRNTPERMHVLRLFIKPSELAVHCRDAGLRVREWTGIRPSLGPPFWRLLGTRVVPEGFRFRLTPSLAVSYLGVAEKNP